MARFRASLTMSEPGVREREKNLAVFLVRSLDCVSVHSCRPVVKLWQQAFPSLIEPLPPPPDEKRQGQRGRCSRISQRRRRLCVLYVSPRRVLRSSFSRAISLSECAALPAHSASRDRLCWTSLIGPRSSSRLFSSPPKRLRFPASCVCLVGHTTRVIAISLSRGLLSQPR